MFLERFDLRMQLHEHEAPHVHAVPVVEQEPVQVLLDKAPATPQLPPRTRASTMARALLFAVAAALLLALEPLRRVAAAVAYQEGGAPRRPTSTKEAPHGVQLPEEVK